MTIFLMLWHKYWVRKKKNISLVIGHTNHFYVNHLIVTNVSLHDLRGPSKYPHNQHKNQLPPRGSFTPHLGLSTHYPWSMQALLGQAIRETKYSHFYLLLFLGLVQTSQVYNESYNNNNFYLHHAFWYHHTTVTTQPLHVYTILHHIKLHYIYNKAQHLHWYYNIHGIQDIKEITESIIFMAVGISNLRLSFTVFQLMIIITFNSTCFLSPVLLILKV